MCRGGRGGEESRNGIVFASVKINSWVRPCKGVSLKQCLESAEEQQWIPESRWQTITDTWSTDGERPVTKFRIHSWHGSRLPLLISLQSNDC